MTERQMMAEFIKLIKIALTIMLVQSFLALLISTAAVAQESLLATLDADRDGLISLDESTGHRSLAENFHKIDVNKDGFISLLELEESRITTG
jgi:hypothetical protein